MSCQDDYAIPEHLWTLADSIEGLCIRLILLPSMSAVESIESVPFVCVCRSVCLSAQKDFVFWITDARGASTLGRFHLHLALVTSRVSRKGYKNGPVCVSLCDRM